MAFFSCYQRRVIVLRVVQPHPLLVPIVPIVIVHQAPDVEAGYWDAVFGDGVVDLRQVPVEIVDALVAVSYTNNAG